MKSQNFAATSLGELLDQIESAASDSDQVSLDTVMGAVGRRSFGPILVLVGLIILAPVVGDIPGVPTVMALVVWWVTPYSSEQRHPSAQPGWRTVLR